MCHLVALWIVEARWPCENHNIVCIACIAPQKCHQMMIAVSFNGFKQRRPTLCDFLPACLSAAVSPDVSFCSNAAMRGLVRGFSSAIVQNNLSLRIIYLFSTSMLLHGLGY